MGLATSRHGLITASDASAHGVPRAVVRWAADAGRLVRVGHGAYVETSLWDGADARARHVLRLRAALARTPAAVAVAESAAVVLGLPLPEIPEQVQLLVPRPALGTLASGGNGRGSSGVGRRRAELAHDELVVLADLRTTTAARTTVDCARRLDPPWALAVGDAARRRFRLSRDQLRRAALRRPRAPGHPTARWVAERAVTTAESPLESLARAVTMIGGHPESRTQVWIHTRRGPFRVDLLDPRGRVVTEADGRVKYATPGDVWREKRREDALRDQGLEVVRFTHADYREPGPWLESYRRALIRAHGTLT